MADQDRKASATVPSIQCDPETKDKFSSTAKRLKWTMQEVAAFAGDLLVAATSDEESPEDRKARMLAKIG